MPAVRQAQGSWDVLRDDTMENKQDSFNTSPDVRGTFVLFGRESVYLAGDRLAEIQGAVHFENDNHLAVDYFLEGIPAVN
ncbi:hypothetical protein EYF80_048291 [Liparis tanakae]|uniref:Uncharacterized protein n=1 Tax=Liparis tanakae TaxID=230148 RepID=A0A4Z2FKX3_9TELE|nr:hypothetical protein EYF80_048291 [Liparis tanakae]